MPRSNAEIAGCFVDAGGRRTDTVVLACTHYPLLTERFRANRALAARLARSGAGHRPPRRRLAARPPAGFAAVIAADCVHLRPRAITGARRRAGGIRLSGRVIIKQATWPFLS